MKRPFFISLMRIHRVAAALLAAIALPVSLRADEGWAVRAAAYLDARQQDWTAFASAGRGTGTTRTLCVSCHTGVPYALSRPALRALSGAKAPTAHETRIAETAALRATHWADIETPAVALYYDESPDKKRESRGTEAVLNALLLALRDRADRAAEARPATQAAFDAMWSEQIVEGPHAGGWVWMDYGLSPWEAGDGRAFGTALAALAVASMPGEFAASPTNRAGVDRLRASVRTLAGAEGQSLHHRAWLLWAGSALPGALPESQRDAIAAALVAAREGDGGWRLGTMGSYTRSDGSAIPAGSDGYATALAVIALRRAGRPAGDPTVAGGLAWLRSKQKADGSWEAPSLNEKRDPATRVGRFMNDAATGLAALALSGP